MIILKALPWRLELRQSLSELSVSLFIIVCNMLWCFVKNYHNGTLILVACKWCERGNRLEGWKLLPQWSHQPAKQRSDQPTWAISWCASEGVWVLQSSDWGEQSETTNGLLHYNQLSNPLTKQPTTIPLSDQLVCVREPCRVQIGEVNFVKIFFPGIC